MNKLDAFFLGMFAGIIIMTITTAIMFTIVDDEPQPTAIDVYQNKTTLEIIYRDYIAIDSVVVFK